MEALKMIILKGSLLRMHTFLMLAMFATFICALPTGANDAAYEGHGATVYLVKEARIRMVSETVNIFQNPKALKDSSQRGWVAVCTFRFQNLTDKTVDIQMGFPDWQTFSERLDDPWAIGEFEAFVDNKNVRAVHKKVKPALGEKRVHLPGGSGIPYDASYTWQVHFKPHGFVTVRNRYSFGGYSSNGPFSDIIGKKRFPLLPVIEPRHLFWNTNRPVRRKGPFYGNSAYREIVYIITTALSWAGNISSADISIELPPKVLPHLVLPFPTGYRIRDRKIQWKFKNWRPQSEIAVYSLFPILSDADNDYSGSPIFHYVKEAKAWIKLAEENHYDIDTVNILRNAVLAKYGFEFSDAKLRSYFEQFHWYTPKQKFSYDNVSPEDKKIISVLKDFERTFSVQR